MASPRAAAGVRMAPRMCGVRRPPIAPIRTESTTKKVVDVPTIFLARASLRAPTAWPIMMLAAMVTPKAAPNIRNEIWLALDVAVNAASPSTWLTQIALAERFNDCRMFEPKTGNENMISVLAIGPTVRSGPLRLSLPPGDPWLAAPLSVLAVKAKALLMLPRRLSMAVAFGIVLNPASRKASLFQLYQSPTHGPRPSGQRQSALAPAVKQIDHDAKRVPDREENHRLGRKAGEKIKAPQDAGRANDPDQRRLERTWQVWLSAPQRHNRKSGGDERRQGASVG